MPPLSSASSRSSRSPRSFRHRPSPSARRISHRSIPTAARPAAGSDRFRRSSRPGRRQPPEDMRGRSSLGWPSPQAPTRSPNASSVLSWKWRTRSALSGTTRARWRSWSWVATPVGQRSVWQARDWMQPSANMKPRAALHQSAPSASMRAMSKPVTMLPAAPSLIRSRRPDPTRALCANTSPSRIGVPTWSQNSSGAAPVPPSVPSTTTKSAMMPVSSIALQIAMNSHGWPMHSLKPTGLPPDSSRSWATNCTISSGVEKAEWRDGEMQSTPTGTPRAAAISATPWRRAGRRHGRAWRPARA